VIPASTQDPNPALTPLTADQSVIVEDESAQLAAVVSYLAARDEAAKKQTTEKTGKLDFDSELIALRDQIGEARMEDQAALMAQMLQVAAIAKSHAPIRKEVVDPRSPYFGHLRLEEGGKTRSVLIGKRGLVDRGAGVVIVDWRNAPVSRIYYRYEEGDDYEEEFGEQVKEGLVRARRTLSIHKGEIRRIRCPQGLFLHRPDGSWTARTDAFVPELKGGAGIAARAPAPVPRGHLGHHGDDLLRSDKHLPEISALIDRAQFEAMTQSEAGVVVLQGGAGSGKTTVALHRIAYLTYVDPKRFRIPRILVVVSHPSLVRYTEQVLPSLDVSGVKVRAYEAWAQGVAKRVVPRQKRRVLQDVPGEVSQLKKHPGMLRAMDDQVARRAKEVLDGLEESLGENPEAKGIIARAQMVMKSKPIAEALQTLLSELKRRHGISNDARERARRVFAQGLDQVANILEEWEELITDASLLAPHVVGGEHGLSPRELEVAMAWTALQTDEPLDDSHIDPSARRPVDREQDDDEEARHAFDVHDFPLLLNLCIARHGALLTPQGQRISYDHVAVDEAQDLSAVEIRPLYVASAPHHSLTLAGDIVQKVVFDNGFEKWEELLQDLGTEAMQVEPFRLTYRSTHQVTELAHDILGPLAPAEKPAAIRSGAPVEAFAFDEPGEEVAFLAESLRNLMGREPQSNVAVLCRYPERAAFFYQLLQDAEVPRVRHPSAGDFTFAPGVDVTHIRAVKGLEYDYVVLLEVNAAQYPRQDDARHLLHIGATRAAHQLWITTRPDSPSPLLPASLLASMANV
jgi:DNA helicase-2/ATP-dependent DNA helicase PcrA